jgi:hypothetical protein
MRDLLTHRSHGFLISVVVGSICRSDGVANADGGTVRIAVSDEATMRVRCLLRGAQQREQALIRTLEGHGRAVHDAGATIDGNHCS